MNKLISAGIASIEKMALLEIKCLQKDNERLYGEALSSPPCGQTNFGGGFQGKSPNPSLRRRCVDLIQERLNVPERRALSLVVNILWRSLRHHKVTQTKINPLLI